MWLLPTLLSPNPDFRSTQNLLGNALLPLATTGRLGQPRAMNLPIGYWNAEYGMRTGNEGIAFVRFL